MRLFVPAPFISSSYIPYLVQVDPTFRNVSISLCRDDSDQLVTISGSLVNIAVRDRQQVLSREGN